MKRRNDTSKELDREKKGKNEKIKADKQRRKGRNEQNNGNKQWKDDEGRIREEINETTRSRRSLYL